MSTLWKLLTVQIIVCAIFSLPAEGSWQYLMVRFNWTSTDEKVLRTPLRPVRIEPGVYGLSGTVEVGAPLDNSFMFEFSIYRSATGSSNFVKTPFRIPKIPFEFFMNTAYRQFAMNDVRNCSDFPVFEGRFKGPVEPTVFHLNKCMVKSNSMPNIVRAGFYKIVIRVSSPLVELVAELISQVYENVY